MSTTDRRHKFSFVGVVFAVALLWSAQPLLAADAPHTQMPCVSATSACVQWVYYHGGPARSMVYATYPLHTRNTQVTEALIMVHGALRNADHYFRTATAAAFLAGALQDTIVIAPDFTARNDPRHKDEVVWPEGRVSWRDGGRSTTNPNLTSYDFLDRLQEVLADKKTFPNLTRIVIAGHSAGGQTVNRYEMTNKVDGTLKGIDTSYLPANPSTYAWPTASRPLPVGGANPTGAFAEAVLLGTKVNADFKFWDANSRRGKSMAEEVPSYDQWPMGLENLKGYAKGMSADHLTEQLVSRDVTYLLSQVDVLPLGGFDSRPVAMLQGPTRRARGEAYVAYLDKYLGAHAKVLIVPECPHNDRCVFTTREVLPLLFPNQKGN